MARSRSRRRWWMMVGAASGLCLALAGAWLKGDDAAQAVVVEPISRATTPTRVQPPAPAIQVEPDPGRAIPAIEDLPPLVRSRAEWARDRADWTGGGWMLCDLSPYDPDLASVIFDENGYDGNIDPATLIMSVGDGWLALAVHEPSGEAIVDLGGIFSPHEPVRIRWSGADGDDPGRCLGPPEPLEQNATLEIVVVEADGGPLSDPEGVQTEILGCGLAITDNYAGLVEPRPCTLSIARRRTWLPSQVTRGALTEVHPTAGATTRVTLFAPPPPEPLRVPDLDDTMLLLDVAAYSGSETLADGLEVVVDDLATGRFHPQMVETWRRAAEAVEGGESADALDVIQASWGVWSEIQEMEADER